MSHERNPFQADVACKAEIKLGRISGNFASGFSEGRRVAQLSPCQKFCVAVTEEDTQAWVDNHPPALQPYLGNDMFA
jgi:hypothetical protein